MTDSLPSAAIFVSSRSFLSRLLLAWRDENGCEGNYMAVRQQSYLATIKYELQYFILRPIKNINLIFLSHGSKVHQKKNRGPANMSEKKKKRWHVWLSAVYDYTQEQNGSRYVSTIVRQYTWLSLPRKIVEIQEFCYYCGVTSHFSLLIQPCSQSPQGQIWRERAQHWGKSGRSAGSVIRSSRYHDEPNSGFIQNLQQFFKDFSRTTLDFQGPPTGNIPSLF